MPLVPVLTSLVFKLSGFSNKARIKSCSRARLFAPDALAWLSGNDKAVARPTHLTPTDAILVFNKLREQVTCDIASRFIKFAHILSFKSVQLKQTNQYKDAHIDRISRIINSDMFPFFF